VDDATVFFGSVIDATASLLPSGDECDEGAMRQSALIKADGVLLAFADR
jgi:hypothetical protein